MPTRMGSNMATTTQPKVYTPDTGVWPPRWFKASPRKPYATQEGAGAAAAKRPGAVVVEVQGVALFFASAWYVGTMPGGR